jgi:hypothetical protein
MHLSVKSRLSNADISTFPVFLISTPVHCGLALSKQQAMCVSVEQAKLIH